MLAVGAPNGNKSKPERSTFIGCSKLLLQLLLQQQLLLQTGFLL